MFKLPEFLPKAAGKSEIVERIKEIIRKASITLDDDQIDRIASLPSYRWAQDSWAEVQAKIKSLKAEIADHQAVLADPAKQRDIYKKELTSLRKLSKVDR